MRKKVMYFVLGAALAALPLAFVTGCAETQGRESAGAYAKDKEIQTKIRDALYSDPVVKGTQVQVQSLNGEVQLTGFVDSEQARDRAVQIASRTPGVVRVYNNLIMPTGR